MYPEGIVHHEFVSYLCLDSPLFYFNHFWVPETTSIKRDFNGSDLFLKYLYAHC